MLATLALVATVAVSGCGAVYLPTSGGATPAASGSGSASGVAVSGSTSGGVVSKPVPAPPVHLGPGPVIPGASGSSSGSGAPSASPQRVTLTDNGKTVTMHVGDTFLLALGDQQQWSVQVADQTIVARVPNIMVVRGAQGVYRALKAGTTTLSATGAPQCSAGQACPMYVIGFHVTVQVLAGA